MVGCICVCVQKYYWDPKHENIVYNKWETIVRLSISGLVSKRKRAGKKPEFIGIADWTSMLELWEEEEHVKKCKTNAENASSNPDGQGSHRHTSGSVPHIRVAHVMGVEAGGPVPMTVVVIKTHSNKNGAIVDKRVEALVKQAEALAMEKKRAQGSVSDSESSELSSQELTTAYIETATNKKGRIYGLGSIQFLDADANEASALTILRNAETEMELQNVKKDVSHVKEDISHVKDDVSHIKKGVELLLKLQGINPVTHEPVPPESAGSGHGRSLHSESSQQINDLG